MKEAGVIIGATLGFASIAWHAGMVNTPPPACDAIRIVSYLPIPEPTPLMKTPPLGWPIEDRALEPRHEEPEAQTEDDAEEKPRRHFRHRRHRWR